MSQEHIPLQDMNPTTYESFYSELRRILNAYGVDALLSTPDHVLATMVIKNLDNYGEAIATTKRLTGMDFNQQPVTKTVQLGNCRGPVEIPHTP